MVQAPCISSRCPHSIDLGDQIYIHKALRPCNVGRAEEENAHIVVYKQQRELRQPSHRRLGPLSLLSCGGGVALGLLFGVAVLSCSAAQR